MEGMGCEVFFMALGALMFVSSMTLLWNYEHYFYETYETLMANSVNEYVWYGGDR